MKSTRYIFFLMLSIFILSCSPSLKNTPTKKPPIDNNSNQTTTSQTKGIDTARDEDYMTEREKDMIKEINLIRSNPKGYIAIVETYIENQKKMRSQITSGFEYMDEEIKTAHELIKELEKTPKLSILLPHKGLYKAAKLHGEEGKKRGKLDHQSKNGDWPWDRILEHAVLKNGGENLVGGLENVREAVLVLLVDSGIEGRGHRKALLTPDWIYVACYEVGTVGDMPFYWVQNFGN
jgi:uncharacterized protein YkwD